MSLKLWKHPILGLRFQRDFCNNFRHSNVCNGQKIQLQTGQTEETLAQLKQHEVFCELRWKALLENFGGMRQNINEFWDFVFVLVILKLRREMHEENF